MVLGGFVLAEVLQRRDPHRRTLGQIVKEDICDPLDLDFMIGARLLAHRTMGPAILQVLNLFVFRSLPSDRSGASVQRTLIGAAADCTRVPGRSARRWSAALHHSEIADY